MVARGCYIILRFQYRGFHISQGEGYVNHILFILGSFILSKLTVPDGKSAKGNQFLFLSPSLSLILCLIYKLYAMNQWKN